jgi:hypothetical protein
MNISISRLSPPGASGALQDAAPSHGLASPSIRPNTRRADSNPVAAGVAALLVAAILGELVLFAVIVRSIL